MRCLACGAEYAPDPGGARRNHDVCWLRAIHIRVFRLSSSGPATCCTMKSGHSQKSECGSPLDGSRLWNMGVSVQVAWSHARSNLHGWIIGSFIAWRHRAVSILIVGIIITIALAGSLMTWDGAKGPTGNQGPAGPKGPTGNPGPLGEESGQVSSLRIVQSNCDQTSCTAQCGENEILLTAYCGPKRNAASSQPIEPQRAAPASPRTTLWLRCAPRCRLLDRHQVGSAVLSLWDGDSPSRRTCCDSHGSAIRIIGIAPRAAALSGSILSPPAPRRISSWARRLISSSCNHCRIPGLSFSS